MNPISISQWLRDYADQIDAGAMAPTKAVLLFDNPGVIAPIGFHDLARLRELADAVAPIWNAGVEE